MPRRGPPRKNQLRLVTDDDETPPLGIDADPPEILRLVKSRRGKRAATVALEEWRRLAPKLEEDGRLNEQSRGTVLAMCLSFGRWIYSEERIARDGDVWTSEKTGYSQQTAVYSIRNAEMARYRTLCGELGLTPATLGNVVLKKRGRSPDEEKAARLFKT